MAVPPLALVVEDDEPQREMLSEFLKDEGLEVINCESAEAAELIIGHLGQELNLIITDFRLAGEGNGADIADFAQAQFPDLRVIIVSGDRNARVPAGVRFLQKPFDLRQMLAA